MSPRHVLTALLALSVACSASSTLEHRRHSLNTSSEAVSVGTSTGLPVLELRLRPSSIPAGGCTRATVLAGENVGGRVEIHRSGDSAPEATLRLHLGRGSASVCAGWTGGPLKLRAVAPTIARSSATVPLDVQPAPWMRRVEALLGGSPVSVAVAVRGRLLYGHLDEVPRAPASNEKLLLSMALLDRFGPAHRIPTTVEAHRSRGMIPGDLWLVGHGDPEVDGGTIARLARMVADAGIRRIRGSVLGDTSTFTRERWAPGWHKIALQFISVPTALTFDQNSDANGFVFDPEARAAAAMTADLRSLGVSVGRTPGAGVAPTHLPGVATSRSAPLSDILRRQNVESNNLDAEVLDKLLGASASGPPGTIAKGAAAIQAWAARYGVSIVAHDAAGLSYRNRISTEDMVQLLEVADSAPWGAVLRSTLPVPGEGTLAGRLAGLRVRAKTGTLIQRVSALSGWVWLRHARRWAEFSILSKGLSKAEAVTIEDAVVRIVANA